MNNQYKCPLCKGRRFVEGIGYMRTECNECGGKGYLMVSKPTVTPSVHLDIPNPPKRRGRPPKSKEIDHDQIDEF